jgi:hypothetical protein
MLITPEESLKIWNQYSIISEELQFFKPNKRKIFPWRF